MKLLRRQELLRRHYGARRMVVERLPAAVEAAKAAAAKAAAAKAVVGVVRWQCAARRCEEQLRSLQAAPDGRTHHERPGRAVDVLGMVQEVQRSCPHAATAAADAATAATAAAVYPSPATAATCAAPSTTTTPCCGTGAANQRAAAAIDGLRSEREPPDEDVAGLGDGQGVVGAARCTHKGERCDVGSVHEHWAVLVVLPPEPEAALAPLPPRKEPPVGRDRQGVLLPRRHGDDVA